MGQPNFPTIETEVLERWKEQGVFTKTLEKTKGKKKRFVFFEGPPTANGKPGIHHVIARAFKDVICRFKTMQGFFVERKAGWDTQGLPVELEVEKQLKVSGKKDIEKYGIEKFNEACRDSVWKYQAEWEKMTERIGYWLDLEHPYVTYHKEYIESLWWIFKQLWDKKLLVKDYKVVPQCPRCETALSSHEVAQGYEKVTEDSVYVQFKIKKAKGKIKEGDYILSWTTTPWTLPGNVGLAVGKDIGYVITNNATTKERFIVSKKLWMLLMPADMEHAQEIQGSDLVDLEYEPLFPGAIPSDTKGYENAFKVYAADFVTTDEGTGVVHTAVMYGEDDYQLGTKVGLPKHHTVTPDGHFTDDVKEFAGQFVKDEKTQQGIVEYLKEKHLLYDEKPYQHDYPFCWRCHSPLLYYAKDSWFIKMSSLREQLIANNEQINWVPEYIKHGRFGEWLNEVKDWAVSRERYWGTPLPIWECETCHERECIGSFEGLHKRSGKKDVVSESFDPHRPFIDAVELKCTCGGAMKRIPEVADAWFDSGSMPYAQWHYPFENKDRIGQGMSFPGEYIAEAIDQTRGWFYTLLALSTALGFNEPPYKNVICLGHVLDAKGLKMSKHIGNVVDPWTMFDKYGADAIRYYFFSVNQPGDVKLFDEKNVNEVVKKVFMILWNVTSFWELYRSPKPPKPIDPLKRPLLDKWVRQELRTLITNVTTLLESYDLTSSSRAVGSFINILSTWYVRRSRDRFKVSGDDRASAEETLQLCLGIVARLLAPFTPMIADALWFRLGNDESVHLQKWPDVKEAGVTAGINLIEPMEELFRLVEIGHSIRAEAGIRVRQPLGQFVIQSQALDQEIIELLQDELNVREVVFAKSLPTDDGWRMKMSENISVALDCTITDELREAGWVRELARHINDGRKTLGVQPGDKVRVTIQSDEPVITGMIERYGDDIKKAGHAIALEIKPAVENGTAIEIGNKPLVLKVERASSPD